MDVNFKIVHDKSSIDRQNKDNVLMLKALVNGWDMTYDKSKGLWEWCCIDSEIFEIKGSGDFPCINDTLREELIKRYGE